jgi:hypothetical protein
VAEESKCPILGLKSMVVERYSAPPCELQTPRLKRFWCLKAEAWLRIEPA